MASASSIPLKEKTNYAFEKLEENLSQEDKIKYFKRTVSISKKQIDECKELLDLMGIPYVNAVEEADSQCAQLVKDGLAEGVLTEEDAIAVANKILEIIGSTDGSW